MSLRALKLISVGALFFFFLSPLRAEEKLREVSLPLPSDMRSFERIRILVARDKPEIKLSCKTAFEVYDDQGRVIVRDAKLDGATVKPVQGGIQWWTRVVPSRSLLIKSSGGGIQISRAGLYGDMILLYKNSKNKLNIINELQLENYLKSVIAFEANPKWAPEALKAQAVVSRTFALFKMLERQNEEYDVSSGVFSQVYTGKKIEDQRTNQAIESTQGEILIYNNKILNAFFHSTCGGATTSADLVWRVKSNPALSGAECRFCKGSPHYRWEAKITRQEILEKLAKQGMPLKDIQSIKLDKVDRSGRAHKIIIKSTWWQKELDADAFRVWIDPARLKSSLITSVTADAAGNYIFKGRGWGHGVGMCQYGMKYLGELGYNYREILDYYYPGVQIAKLKGFEE